MSVFADHHPKITALILLLALLAVIAGSAFASNYVVVAQVCNRVNQTNGAFDKLIDNNIGSAKAGTGLVTAVKNDQLALQKPFKGQNAKSIRATRLRALRKDEKSLTAAQKLRRQIQTGSCRPFGL